MLFWINFIHFCLAISRSTFYQHGLTLIPARISNHMPSKVWDKITYPLPNFNGCTIEVWEWICSFIQHILDVVPYPCWQKRPVLFIITHPCTKFFSKVRVWWAPYWPHEPCYQGWYQPGRRFRDKWQLYLLKQNMKWSQDSRWVAQLCDQW